MSPKKRNRSITTLPPNDQSNVFVNLHVERQINCLDKVLGENINDFVPLNLSKGDCSANSKFIDDRSTFDSDLEDIFDLKLSGVSSSSSLSWSDDYDSEVNKKVQTELEKIDRCFQGFDVPLAYDKAEIEEWRTFFPHLIILGYKTPSNSLENSEESSASDDEVQTNNVKNKYGKIYLRNLNKIKNEQQMQNLLYQKGQMLANKPKSLDIDQYLKISAIKSPYLNRSKQDAQSVITTDRFDVNTSLESISLPFITATPLKSQPRRPIKQQQRTVSKLILPPIMNRLRSVSATPRQSSSKSMFVCLNFEKDAKAKQAQMELKSDLMKLFETIPISNR
ncbi:uncharacterized protein LOC115884459 [Sitophilus oryzae]|uniref:Uncharacterized protein LOC115884459 n=1 Tax=Sitophilus oryzae TaxID=7048 RepID=A0A6J2Y752_SITOR|nr:uncharacterized protein LOC115884459 [Sitophilus oryzae]